MFFTKPENNVVISTGDLAVAGIVSDAGAGSKVGIAYMQLSVAEGPCRFNRDFFGAPVTASFISGTYCSSLYYMGEQNQSQHLCVSDIGTVSNFTFNNNLRDYVDFSQGQDCRFLVSAGGNDRVGNQAEIKDLNFWVDQPPPAVAINEPVVLSTGLHWSDPAIISGTAVDISDITSVWLTIKDEGTKKWWDGASWVASQKWFNGSQWVETEIKVSATKSGTNNVSWSYAGLAGEVMRSGLFTITAYARDKFGHVGRAVLSGKNKAKYALGDEEFTSVSMAVREVKNNSRSLPDNIYSFTSKTGENNIFVSAEISPARLAGTLNNYVQWNVYGTNSYSGKPDAPHGGNPSNFLVEIPPVIALPLGRPGPMGYTVFPKIEYDYEDVHREYYSPNHRGITQDNLDTLRQEYLDLKAPLQARLDFDQIATPNYPRLLDFANGDIDASHQWWIVEDLYANAAALDNAYTGNLHVTAGYRCPIGNKAKGGVYNSRHMRGTALDYNQNSDSQENCKVWSAARNLGVTENLLYDAFNLGKSTSSPVCPSTELQNYTHGHVAW